MLGSGGIKFVNLTAKSTLSIYTLSGKLVYSFKDQNFVGGELIWNGRNAASKYVAPGIYIYVITDVAGKKKTGKIVIKK